MTREQLIEDSTESINIGCTCDLGVLSRGLLRRDVTWRSKYFHSPCNGAVRFHQTHQTKVSQVRFALRVEQDISRFYIAMQDPALMRVMNRAGEAGNNLRGAAQGNSFATNELIELATLLEFHAEVAGAVALADLVDWNDAGMFETGRRFRLATKPLQVCFGSPGGPDQLP